MKFFKRIKSVHVLLFAGSLLLLTGLAFTLSSIILISHTPNVFMDNAIAASAGHPSDNNAIQLIDEPIAIANTQSSPVPTPQWSDWSDWMNAGECAQQQLELETIPDDQSSYTIETQSQANANGLMRFRWRIVHQAQ